MTPEHFKAARERCEKARGGGLLFTISGDFVRRDAEYTIKGVDRAKLDFIVNAYADLGAVLDEIERLRGPLPRHVFVCTICRMLITDHTDHDEHSGDWCRPCAEKTARLMREDEKDGVA